MKPRDGRRGDRRRHRRRARALCAKYGKRVTVVESHDVAGGAAHSWKRDGYTFESGPSLYSGMSRWPTTNPCGQVLHALDEPLPCVYYNTWMCHLPEGSFLTEVGNDQFVDVLKRFVPDVDGVNAAQEWLRLKTLMKPLAAASSALPPSAVRTDAFAAVTLARFVPGLLAAAPVLPEIMAPYSSSGEERDQAPVHQKLDGVLLSQRRAGSGTLAAEIGYMFDDWYRPNSTLEFPVGGSEAIVEALARGLRKNGGRLELRSHVESVDVDGDVDGANGRATGVTLRNGSKIVAKEAVISNATVWDTLKILPPNAMESVEGGEDWVKEVNETKTCASFMHLHLGIDAAGLPDDLEIHHIYVEDWDRGVTAEQNMVLVSIASVLDPSLAPEGKHVITRTPPERAADLWQGLERGHAGVRAAQGGAERRLVARVESHPGRARPRGEVLRGLAADTAAVAQAQGTYGARAGSRKTRTPFPSPARRRRWTGCSWWATPTSRARAYLPSLRTDGPPRTSSRPSGSSARCWTRWRRDDDTIRTKTARSRQDDT